MSNLDAARCGEPRRLNLARLAGTRRVRDDSGLKVADITDVTLPIGLAGTMFAVVAVVAFIRFEASRQ